MPLELVKDEAGHPKVNAEGHVLYKDEKGAELAFDGSRLHDTLRSIREERDREAEARQAALEELSKFGKTPEEREAAREALRKAAAGGGKPPKGQNGGGDGATFTQEQLDELVAERVKPLQENLEKKLREETEARDRRIEALQTQLREEKIEKWMDTSEALKPFFLTGTAAYRMVGHHFDLDANGKVIAYADPKSKKNKIYSRTNPSEVAEPDEALAILLNGFPGIEKMRRGTGSSGGGAPGGEGGEGGPGRMSRAEFNRLGPAAQQKAVLDGVQLYD